MNKAKRQLFHILIIVIPIILFAFITYQIYTDTQWKISNAESAYNASIVSTDQMTFLLYSQSNLIMQYTSEIDTPKRDAFQSYATSFLNYYNKEYEIASTPEELNYVYQIYQEYNTFLDCFSVLQKYISDDPGYSEDDVYLYCRLTLFPQVSSVYTAILNYKDYLQTERSLLQGEFETALRHTMLALVVFLILSALFIYLWSLRIIRTSLKPLYGVLEEKQKFETSKSNFFATVSHEIKTPLTSIVMGADLLENPAIGELNDDQKELVATIKEDSFLLTTLVTNMIQITRIESSNLSYLFEACDIMQIVNHSLQQYNHIADRQNINLILSCRDNLPRINADNDKLVWVMNNLLSNAFKHSEAGDCIHINIGITREDPECITVSVADQGPGIPEEYSEKIFEKYFQVSESDVELGGTGLGLAIAKDIIGSHNGRIWYNDNIPRGSVFSFTIPVITQTLSDESIS